MQQLKRLASMRSNYIFLIILLLLQFLLCLHFGNEKAGFHEDEIATYGLANSPDGIWPTWGINQWRSGEEYKNSFLVNQNTRFSYTMVYENQEKDVHPPLYYMIIHTISSFVPGIFFQMDRPYSQYCFFYTDNNSRVEYFNETHSK